MSLTYLGNVVDASGDYYYAHATYSGFAVYNGKIWMKGGGHAATGVTQIVYLDPANLAANWQGNGDHSTNWLNPANLDNPTRTWIWETSAQLVHSGEPWAAHSYTGIIYVPALGEFVLMCGGNGQPTDLTTPPWPAESTGFYKGPGHYYKPSTHTYRTSTTVTGRAAEAYCLDPNTGYILCLSNFSAAVFDPVTDAFLSNVSVGSFSALSVMDIEGSLCHFPPNGKLYYFSKKGNVCEVIMSPDRKTIVNVVDLGVSRPMSNAFANAVHYVYDPVNHMLIGGLSNDKMYGWDGTQWWTVNCPGTGNGVAYCYAYVNGEVFFYAKQSGGYRGYMWKMTWANAVPLNTGTPPATVSDDGNRHYTITAGTLTGWPTTDFQFDTTITGAGKTATLVDASGVDIGNGQGPFNLWTETLTMQDFSVQYASVAARIHYGVNVFNRIKWSDSPYGVLSDNTAGIASVTFNDCDFVNIAPASGGQEHAIYIGIATSCKLYVNNCTFINTGAGHFVKSRALETHVYGCILGNPDCSGTNSFCIDAPMGGFVTVDQCYMYRGPSSGNSALIAIGQERGDNRYLGNDPSFFYDGVSGVNLFTTYYDVIGNSCTVTNCHGVSTAGGVAVTTKNLPSATVIFDGGDYTGLTALTDAPSFTLRNNVKFNGLWLPNGTFTSQPAGSSTPPSTTALFDSAIFDSAIFDTGAAPSGSKGAAAYYYRQMHGV